MWRRGVSFAVLVVFAAAQAHLRYPVASLHHTLETTSSGGRSRTVTIRNDQPRTDINGNIIDAHSGGILCVNGTYYWYGERYGNATGYEGTWASQGAPVVGVYTSTDLLSWKDEGLIFPQGTGIQWVPWVVYDETRHRFVAWFGMGVWGNAVSDDGIHFSYPDGVLKPQSSRLGGQTDGNYIFIDDDGQGYIIFAGLVDGHRPQNHLVSIERLSEDYLTATHVNVTGFFPDDFVESPVLFKRKGVYYVAYGNCCCACREGSGFVVFTSKSIMGPWVRQSLPNSDANCPDPSAPICRGDAYGSGHFTVPAQGYTISVIPSATPNGDPTLLWMGNLWLQGPGNNPSCKSLCGNSPHEACEVSGQPNYRLGRDPTYWAPVQFDEAGRILPFVWTDAFEVEIPA